jgi:hypothetical protein
VLRNFTFSPVKATHLRIVVRNTRFVRVAEVQAYGGNSSAQG